MTQMPPENYWDRLAPKEMQTLIENWLATLRGDSGPDLDQSDFSVMTMMFTASPEMQWDFLLRAIQQAQTDKELCLIAVGPLETLLGRFGEQLIDTVEEQARSNPRFLRTLTGVWKNRMSDATWNRVQAIQSKCDDPLP